VTAAEVAASLAGSGVTVIHPSIHLEDGARVTVSYEGITAHGTLASRAYHYHTMKGPNTLPVILDGTGQQIDIPARYVTKEATP
jgi:hypothetical protein